MEEYVPGHVETFDGITNADGKVLFYTGQVMAVTPLDMLSGAGENVSWTQPVERVDDLRDAGFRTLKAFNVRSRFFHFEFFRLDEDKAGLGRRGDILGLEVNLRAPGGYIPDKMDYVLDRTRREGQVAFLALFDPERSPKGEIIVTFLAVLELLRQHRVIVYQNAAFHEITILPSKEPLDDTPLERPDDYE